MKSKLECPRCGSEQVEKMKPATAKLLGDQEISPYPSYRCVECGQKMRTRGSLVLYLFVLGLGIGLCGFFLYPFLSGDGEVRMLGKTFFVLVLGGLCAAYSLVQIVLPVPRRPQHRDDVNDPAN